MDKNNYLLDYYFFHKNICLSNDEFQVLTNLIGWFPTWAVISIEATGKIGTNIPCCKNSTQFHAVGNLDH